MVLVVACAPPGEGTPPAESSLALDQPESHRRMVETLRAIADAAETENPYLGRREIERARKDLAAMPEDDIPKRWFLNLYLGQNELRLGNERTALEHYVEANRLLGESRDEVPQEKRIQTLLETGVAYMRWGETENCVLRHTSESCIFPLQGGGVHVAQDGSRGAIEYFEKVLQTAPRASPEHVRALWLINIAYMTLGQYPGEVPPERLIPPERFESDEPFPRFVDIAPDLGLNSFDLAGGAIAEDFDGDHDLDIMVSTMDTSGQTRLYVNLGDGSFEERTEQAGLEGILGGLNTIQADYDNDGDVDVLVLRGGWWREAGRHPNSLLRNNGDGTFSDVTFDAGLGRVHYPTQTGGWADYDNDGDLDLYIGNESGRAAVFDDAETAEARAPCQLFRNNGDGTFTDVATDAGVDNLLHAKAVVWGDYDGNRYPDIFVSNFGTANRLYRNNGDGTFTDVAGEAGVRFPVSSFPSWFWDVNNDGVLDLYVSAFGGVSYRADVASVAASYLGWPHPNELARLYIGDGQGGFQDRAAEWGLTQVTLPMGSNFGDLDNDGYPDFYLGTGYPYYEGLMPNLMYRNRSGERFADVTTAGGFGHVQKGHGVVFADLDNDGDQDVFEQIGGAFPGDAFGNVLFENPGFGNNWIKLRLVGVRSNRFGVGARIRADVIEQGRRRSIHATMGSGGSFGGNPLRAEIGLGQATRIELLEIYWPTSDRTQQFENVAVNQWLEITEGDDAYRKFTVEPVTFRRP